MLPAKGSLLMRRSIRRRSLTFRHGAEVGSWVPEMDGILYLGRKGKY